MTILIVALSTAAIVAAHINAILPKPGLVELGQQKSTLSYLAPSPIFPPFGKPQSILVPIENKKYRVSWDGQSLFLTDANVRMAKIDIGKKRYWVRFDGKRFGWGVQDLAEREKWIKVLESRNPPGEGPPGNMGGRGSNGEQNGDKKKFLWAIFFYGLGSFWSGFYLYLFRELTWVAALTLGIVTGLWFTVKMWFQKDVRFFIRIIGIYWFAGVLGASAYLTNHDGSVLGSLCLGLLTLLTVRLLMKRKFREFTSGMYEWPRPVDPPGKYDEVSKIAAALVWFVAVVGLYLRQHFDLSLILFVSVAIPFFLHGIYATLFEAYSRVSIRVTQIARLERREQEHSYQAWRSKLQKSLKIMVGVSFISWIVIFALRFEDRNLFFDPLIFVMTFVSSFGIWRLYWKIWGRLK